ncbi:ESX secretion-associated protein EspG [Nocardia cyriacigeorgica]|uniref:ESX secretion-associated protein EspG n=1 Tax=Nocardia cyriacigeorgica TaxID=135487 RepID=UPI0018957F2E|nr:ESX secretion-associated protein EspG [Nocardia cyriacigeorgica]MBF6455911.1 ESX secretion-associated protein EspG [Nocardia cyriacigeorgica]MBF6476800.1 ESX secretion-associated protein EspG [Nocardia cyriacigeorgica]MBF6553348.1 ESX secretion-associated protein EspG [Nocardia cyriacigeorgica]
MVISSSGSYIAGSDDADQDPTVVDLNVDAALALQDLTGIDDYPPVLALLPNIYDEDDHARVRAVVLDELETAGIVEDGRVHPVVRQWLHCLDRPDAELVVRVIDRGQGDDNMAMLRMSLVRQGEQHVLAVRCDDHVVIQPVFVEGRSLETLAAAVVAAVGPCPPLEFEPLSATEEQLGEVPSEQTERRQALLELGAHRQTAGVLSRVMDEVVRRAEIVMFEHHDGVQAVPKVSSAVLDTVSGRIVVTPSVAMDGQLWTTYLPGDDSAIATAVAALVELLPGRSWFDTTRIS